MTEYPAGPPFPGRCPTHPGAILREDVLPALNLTMTEYPTTGRSPAFQPCHPGAILREDVLPALNLTVTDAATKLGISRQMLHGILAERHAVTPEMAARIGKFCGNGAGIWLRLQNAHDLWRVEREMADDLARIPTMRAA